MAMKKFDSSEVEMDSVIELGPDQYTIKAYDDDYTSRSLAEALGQEHQPVIACFDTSGSMTDDAGNGKSKLSLCIDAFNNIKKSDSFRTLSALDQDKIDLFTLSFHGDSTYALGGGWQPISKFKGISTPAAGGTTPLYKAINNAIQMTRVMRNGYGTNGISCKRPQIFVYTDGLATDRNNRSATRKLCEEYASKAAGKVKLFVVLIPGTMSEADIQEVSQDMVSLCDNVTLIKLDDCVNGLPESFEFFASSVVVGASSSVGTEMAVDYDADGALSFGNTPMSNGKVYIGKQIQFTK